jgi:hypothetical protein
LFARTMQSCGATQQVDGDPILAQFWAKNVVTWTTPVSSFDPSASDTHTYHSTPQIAPPSPYNTNATMINIVFIRHMVHRSHAEAKDKESSANREMLCRHGRAIGRTGDCLSRTSRRSVRRSYWSVDEYGVYVAPRDSVAAA